LSKYKALTGLNYPDGKGGEKRVEAGEVVSDLPHDSVPWLLDGGLIEEILGRSTKKGGTS
jgi:hypothetical protein